MKKIVFCLQRMILAGVEKELIAVLKKIHNDYDITLLLLYQEDMEILKEIPVSVKIRIMDIDKDYYCGSAADLVRKRIKKGKFLEALSIAIKRCLKIGMTGSNINIDNISAPDDTFDVAVCYHIHSPIMLKYVTEKINAKKKIAWIHNDFYTSTYPIERLKKYVVMYDEFVSVSKKVENEFRTLCTWYQGGVSTAYNYLDVEEILKLAEAEIDEHIYADEKKVKILTVGRFSEQKGIDLAIETCSMLKKNGLDFHWFLIGYGELEELYRKLIKQYEVEDSFTILGKKTNPYPYIKQCDICVQPSRHEAYPLVLMEAKILKRPIVCTDFDGADEQINNNVNGIIVPLNDVNSLCKEISKLIISQEKRVFLKTKLEHWQAEDDLKEIVKHFS